MSDNQILAFLFFFLQLLVVDLKKKRCFIRLEGYTKKKKITDTFISISHDVVMGTKSRRALQMKAT